MKVTASTTAVWLVAYRPAGVVSADEAAARLRALLAQAPVVRLAATAHTPR